VALLSSERRASARPLPALKLASPPARPAPASFAAFVPAEKPVAMPAQSLRKGRLNPVASADISGRRWVLLLGSGVLTAVTAAITAMLFSPGGLTLVDGIAFSLFVLLFAWVAASGPPGAKPRAASNRSR
jgi:hypothetical protein